MNENGLETTIYANEICNKEEGHLTHAEKVSIMLLDSYATNSVVNINFLVNGVIKGMVGIIKKVDLIHNIILLENKTKIKMEYIVDIKQVSNQYL